MFILEMLEQKITDKLLFAKQVNQLERKQILHEKINRTLRIGSWNFNTFYSTSTIYKHFLEMKKIDVYLIAETHLTKQSFVKISGYVINQTAHPI